MPSDLVPHYCVDDLFVGLFEPKLAGYAIETLGAARPLELPAFMREGAPEFYIEPWLILARFRDSPLYAEWRRDPDGGEDSSIIGGLETPHRKQDLLKAWEGMRLIRRWRMTDWHDSHERAHRPANSTFLSADEFGKLEAEAIAAWRKDFRTDPPNVDLAASLRISLSTLHRYRRQRRLALRTNDLE